MGVRGMWCRGFSRSRRDPLPDYVKRRDSHEPTRRIPPHGFIQNEPTPGGRGRRHAAGSRGRRRSGRCPRATPRREARPAPTRPGRRAAAALRRHRRHPLPGGLDLRRRPTRRLRSEGRRCRLHRHLRAQGEGSVCHHPLPPGHEMLPEMRRHLHPRRHPVLERSVRQRAMQPGGLRPRRILLQRELQPLRRAGTGVHAGDLPADG
jgi:hypothetical protein